LFTVEDSNNVTLKLIERAAPSEYRVLLVLKDGPQTHSEILSKLQTGKKSDSKMSSDRLYQVLAKLVKKGLVRKPDSRGGNWTYDVSAQILD
jgi:DNA-binding PadR family transcriptional regulator